MKRLVNKIYKLALKKYRFEEEYEFPDNNPESTKKYIAKQLNALIIDAASVINEDLYFELHPIEEE